MWIRRFLSFIAANVIWWLLAFAMVFAVKDFLGFFPEFCAAEAIVLAIIAAIALAFAIGVYNGINVALERFWEWHTRLPTTS